MDITVVDGGNVRVATTSTCFPLQLPHENLFIGRNIASKFKKARVPDGSHLHEITVCGVDLTYSFPKWIESPEGGFTQSKMSHGYYFGHGDIVLRGMNLGVLFQLLPPGKETSCHSHPPMENRNHPGSEEVFLPLEVDQENTPWLHLSPLPRKLPLAGEAIAAGVPHQLRAPDNRESLTMILMWPIPYATWKIGHIPHDPPFVPYTAKQIA